MSMDLLTGGLAVLAVAGATSAAALAAKLKAARAELEAGKRRSPPPAPPRAVESRRERFGLLWFPTLTVKDEEKLVVAAAAGLPHCARCVRALTLSSGPPEEWACGGCPERRPGTTADIQVTDAIVAETLEEFLARHSGWRSAPGLGSARR